jgi:hypothetical protein
LDLPFEIGLKQGYYDKAQIKNITNVAVCLSIVFQKLELFFGSPDYIGAAYEHPYFFLFVPALIFLILISFLFL